MQYTSVMVVFPIALALALEQQPAGTPKVEIPVLKAGLGACSADFTVKDASGAPVYGAAVHVRVRYGMMGIKRMDLEAGTNSDGKARFEGLPDKAKPLVYDVQKDGRKATVEQKVADTCRATFDVSLK
jgi:hypothetical protein